MNDSSIQTAKTSNKICVFNLSNGMSYGHTAGYFWAVQMNQDGRAHSKYIVFIIIREFTNSHIIIMNTVYLPCALPSWFIWTAQKYPAVTAWLTIWQIKVYHVFKRIIKYRMLQIVQIYCRLRCMHQWCFYMSILFFINQTEIHGIACRFYVFNCGQCMKRKEIQRKVMVSNTPLSDATSVVDILLR